MIVKCTHDPEVHAVAIKFVDAPYAKSVLLDDDRIVDYTPDGTIRGVELLNVDQGVNVNGLPYADEVAAALEQHDIRVYVR